MNTRPVHTGISVLVPLYNEAPSVPGLFTALDAALVGLHVPYEILVINDGSTDGSKVALAQLSLPSLRILAHTTNRGYGAALMTGLRQALYPIIVITDADGTYPVERIPELVAGLASAAMVVGARVGPHARIPLVRRFPKWCLRQLAQLLTGATIGDLNSGLRAMHREALTPLLPVFPRRFSWTSTVTVGLHLLQQPIVYVPIAYHRRTGTSKFHPVVDTARAIGCILRTALWVRWQQWCNATAHR